MKGTVVFDFDYTLFDAQALKDAMAASLAPCGVPEADFWDTYRQTALATEKICDYDPARHMEALRNRLTCDPGEALARIAAVLVRVPEFLLPGATALLERSKAQGWRLVLLTHGNPDWQRRKVERSGLASYFDRMLFAPERKTSLADELRTHPRPLVLVNDSGPEIDELAPLLPEARFVAVRGPKPLPTATGVRVIERLDEVDAVLSGV